MESQHPNFDPGEPAFSERLDQLRNGGTFESALRDTSPEMLTTIKAFYAAVLPEPGRNEVSRATNGAQIEAAIDNIVSEGQRATFTIDQAYKGINKGRRAVDVSSEYTDCGIRFRQGETCLVYAWTEKGSLRTGACSRTRRLSEAGDDLVCLHFLQNGGPDIGRIWGFVSGDERAAKLPHLFDSVPLPVSDLDVQLHSSDRALQAWTDQRGQYVFEGLPAGDYQVAIEGQTREVHLEPKACNSEWFYVPGEKSGK